MQTIHVHLGPRSYDVAVVTSPQDSLTGFIRQAVPRSSRAFLVTDENVDTHAQVIEQQLVDAGWKTTTIIVQAGEATKSLSWASELYDELAAWGADRQTLVVAVGGGVIGDLAGFVAATYNRGLPLLMIPTTLLAMVDSSVGGKVGINHAEGKNLIGAFHQPRGVWIDPNYLDSLPEREYRSGLAEIVKYGVILDPVFFAYLEQNAQAILARDPEVVAHIIARSCQLKADVVQQDEREETGLRVILNYGHTFAHAFETVSGYGHWLHGEAVAVGMLYASRLAIKLDRIGIDTMQRQEQLLHTFGLPLNTEQDWVAEEMLAVMRVDKKSQNGQLRLVLPKRLGEVELVADVPEELVLEVLRS